MRYVSVLGVILVAWAALSPVEAVAKGPSSGGNSGQSGGNWSGGNNGNSGKENWNGGSGSNWQWGYGHPYHGYGYGYGYYSGVPYVAERPIYENPPFSGLPIKITNPAANGVTLSYTLNGVLYTIPPGYSQELVQDRSWVIGFSRGATSARRNTGWSRGCTRSRLRITVGNCTADRWCSPARPQRRRIRRRPRRAPANPAPKP